MERPLRLFRRTPVLAPAVCLSLLSACAATVQPRTARIAEPGRFAWDAYVPMTVVAFGEADGTLETESADGGIELEPVTYRGYSGALADPTDIGTGFFPVWWEGSLRIGVVRRLEAGVIVGPFRLGGEVRYGLAAERDGASLSLAIAGAAAYQPFYDRGGPWWRFGLDVSRVLPKVELMANLHASYGPEAHELALSDFPESLWDRPVDTSVSHDSGAQPYVRVVQQEWRLAMALGVGIGRQESDSPARFVVGLVPYVILDARDTRVVDQQNSSRFDLSTFDEDFGVAIVIGASSR